MAESFILYTAYYAILEPLTTEQMGELMRAVFLYARDGKEPQLPDILKMAFSFIRHDMDKAQASYRRKCLINSENARQRWNRKTTRADASDGTGGNAKHAGASVRIRPHADTDVDTPTHPSAHQRMPSDADGCEPCLYNNIQDISSNESISLSSPTDIDASAAHARVRAGEGEGKGRRRTGIDYQGVLEYWNAQVDATHSAMRHITRLSDSRKAALRARVHEYGGDGTVVKRAIDAAMHSPFLNGHGRKNFIASFDWIFSPAHFPRVLEGSYDDATAPAAGKPDKEQPSSISTLIEQAKKPQAAPADAELRRVLGLIGLVEKNPSSMARRQLENMQKAGVLTRLGIAWTPPHAAAAAPEAPAAQPHSTPAEMQRLGHLAQQADEAAAHAASAATLIASGNKTLAAIFGNAKNQKK